LDGRPTPKSTANEDKATGVDVGAEAPEDEYSYVTLRRALSNPIDIKDEREIAHKEIKPTAVKAPPLHGVP
jgi:hypothetical protein